MTPSSLGPSVANLGQAVFPEYAPSCDRAHPPQRVSHSCQRFNLRLFAEGGRGVWLLVKMGGYLTDQDEGKYTDKTPNTASKRSGREKSQNF